MYLLGTRVHCVGIGGIGMSGIAKIMKLRGYDVSGCDLDTTQQTVQDLQTLGCSIVQGNGSAECLAHNYDVLVYTSAVQQNSEELLAARRAGIPTIMRAQLLWELMRQLYSIAIAGAHGKTTTTALVGHMLRVALFDPTVIVGGYAHNFQTNAVVGSGRFAVVEADESDRSFLYASPALAVITNISREHLDVYADIEDIKKTFLDFLRLLPFYGKAILCFDDVHVRSLAEKLNPLSVVSYGLHASDARFKAVDWVLLPHSSSFTVLDTRFGAAVGTVTLNVPGLHNISNALAAIAIGLELQIPFETIATACATFAGVDRRFTYRGKLFGADLFDDYGHHPHELAAMIPVARARAQKRLVMVFQPHRYTRTEKLWDEFIKVLNDPRIDQLVITDIHAAHEQPIEGITAQKLVEELKKTAPVLSSRISYVPYDSQWAQMREFLKTFVEANDLVVLQGAGKVCQVAALVCE